MLVLPNPKQTCLPPAAPNLLRQRFVGGLPCCAGYVDEEHRCQGVGIGDEPRRKQPHQNAGSAECVRHRQDRATQQTEGQIRVRDAAHEIHKYCLLGNRKTLGRENPYLPSIESVRVTRAEEKALPLVSLRGSRHRSVSTASILLVSIWWEAPGLLSQFSFVASARDPSDTRVPYRALEKTSRPNRLMNVRPP